MYRDNGPDTPVSVLNKEIEDAVKDLTSASPLCPECKKLRETIRVGENREHVLGEKIKSFSDFIHSFDRN